MSINYTLKVWFASAPTVDFCAAVRGRLTPSFPRPAWISSDLVELFCPDPLLLVPPLRHSFCVPQKPEISTTRPEEFTRELRQAVDLLPSRIDIDAKSVEQGLAKLVLTLIEFIRRLLETQALQRMEGTDLSPEQIEDLGL